METDKPPIQDSAWDLREPWTRTIFMSSVLALFTDLEPRWTTRKVVVSLKCNKDQARSALKQHGKTGKIQSEGEKRFRTWVRAQC